MTIFSPQQFARFIKEPMPKVKVGLLYGQDTGKISYFAEQIQSAFAQQRHGDYERVIVEDQALNKNPDKLIYEAQSTGLFGGFRLVDIPQTGTSTFAAISNYIEKSPDDSFVIIRAGMLAKGLKLRTYIEKSPNAFALPCYLDTPAEISQLVTARLGEENLTISRDALSYLTSLLGEDRMVTLREIENLVCYCQGQSEVRLEDVEAICGDYSAISLDEAIDYFCEGNLSEGSFRLDRILSSGVAEAAVLATFSRHLTQLLRMRLAVEGGTNPAQAVKTSRPPVFFKRQATITRQLNKWTSTMLYNALDKLQTTTSQTRSTIGIPQTLSAHFALMLGRP